MNYAVIKTGGKQYRVSEKDIIEVDRLSADEGGKVLFKDVLLRVSEKGAKIGKPYVAGEKVEAKLLEQKRGEKIRVAKFKAKVRYRRVNGFRSSLSKIQIEKI